MLWRFKFQRFSNYHVITANRFHTTHNVVHFSSDFGFLLIYSHECCKEFCSICDEYSSQEYSFLLGRRWIIWKCLVMERDYGSFLMRGCSCVFKETAAAFLLITVISTFLRDTNIVHFKQK